jgi:hypothetical protein
MTTLAPLTHGLQEWSVLCRALASGATTLVVRKGGIHERHGGLFALEHERFVLMPTYLHQGAGRVRAEFSAEVETSDPQPGQLTLRAWAQVAHIWRIAELTKAQALAHECALNADEIAQRFAYRGEPFLFVVVLRAFRFAQPLIIADEPRFAGCRSWVSLSSPISVQGTAPVIADSEFAQRCAAIARVLGQPLSEVH